LPCCKGRLRRPTGILRLPTKFTLLENGLHYLSNGEWKLSQDLVEPFPQGAVAQYGPTRTIFSPELRAEAVFDIQTAEGQRIRGGVRAIQLTDSKTGLSLVLGTVKEGVLGEVLPPAQVVYRSGFDGLDADVLFVWRHNSISQNVILKKRPVLPADMDPSTTRLEVVTELVESPKPVLNTTVLTSVGKPDVRDDATIGLGSLLAVRGQAFPVSGEQALVLTGDHLAEGTPVPVIKQFQHWRTAECSSWNRSAGRKSNRSLRICLRPRTTHPQGLKRARRARASGRVLSLSRSEQGRCKSRRARIRMWVSWWTSSF